MNKRQKILAKLIHDLFDDNQKAFAKAIKKSPAQVNQWLTGYRNIGDGAVRNIELELRLGEGYMDGKIVTIKDWDENTSTTNFQQGKVPLISSIQAGEFSEAIDIYEPGYAEKLLPKAGNGSDHTFALRVEGPSMTQSNGISFPDGMVIYVDPEQRSPENGDFIVARQNGEAPVTFKQFKLNEGVPYLHPLNPKIDDIFDEFEVVGKVIHAGWDL